MNKNFAAHTQHTLMGIRQIYFVSETKKKVLLGHYISTSTLELRAGIMAGCQGKCGSSLWENARSL